MFRLVPTMRRGSATALPQASARYPTIETARTGAAELLREDRILKVMIVRNEIPGGYVEWVDRWGGAEPQFINLCRFEDPMTPARGDSKPCTHVGCLGKM